MSVSNQITQRINMIYRYVNELENGRPMDVTPIREALVEVAECLRLLAGERES